MMYNFLDAQWIVFWHAILGVLGMGIITGIGFSIAYIIFDKIEILRIGLSLVFLMAGVLFALYMLTQGSIASYQYQFASTNFTCTQHHLSYPLNLSNQSQLESLYENESFGGSVSSAIDNCTEGYKV